MRVGSFLKSLIWACFIFIIFLSGCKTFNQLFSDVPHVFYKEILTPTPVSRSSYNAKDSLTFTFYTFCAEIGNDGPSPKEIIEVPDDETRNSIVKSFEKLNLPLRVSSSLERIDSSYFCTLKLRRRKDYPQQLFERLKEQGLLKKNDELQLIAIYRYGAYWRTEVEHEPPAGLVPTGNDRYRIVRVLTSMIIEQDTIAYRSNYYHHDTISVPDIEFPDYNFPQQIWDSLAVFTMQKYMERLK